MKTDTEVLDWLVSKMTAHCFDQGDVTVRVWLNLPYFDTSSKGLQDRLKEALRSECERDEQLQEAGNEIRRALLRRQSPPPRGKRPPCYCGYAYRGEKCSWLMKKYPMLKDGVWHKPLE